jgi:cyclophilin family peptidyl-prolyl cis-trans isomerase
MRLVGLVGALVVGGTLLGAGTAAAQACTPPPADGPRTMRAITTPLGTVRIRLFDRPGEAPAAAARFLDLADAGAYDGSFFHRLVPAILLEAGGFSFDPVDRWERVPDGPAIAAEPGICNVAGTLAVSQVTTTTPDTAKSQWFVNLSDNSTRHAGYTVFGQVEAADVPVVAAIATLHREFGTLMIDDPLAVRELADETFANVPVLEILARPPAGWGCLGSMSPDPTQIVFPGIPVPIWIPAIVDNCGGNAQLEAQARALLRADMDPKLAEQLVWMTVPEPGPAAPLAAAAALALLRARRPRARPRRAPWL